MPPIVFCVGRRNLEWIAKKYVRLSASIRGTVQLVQAIVEVFRELEGNDHVKQVIVNELERKGRSDLAAIVNELL